MNHKQKEIIRSREAAPAAVKTAELFVTQGLKAIAERRRFTVAASSAVAPPGLMEALATEAMRRGLPWPSVFLFSTDGICADAGDDGVPVMSFHSQIADLPVPRGNLHRMPLNYRDHNQGATEYEQLLRAYFGLTAGQLPRFDLVLLSLGAEGDVAGLHPGSAALKETGRLAVASYSNNPIRHLLTITLPVINHAAHVIVVVPRPGAPGPAAAAADRLGTEMLPLKLVKPANGQLTIIYESNAAR